tara:strand:+ start:1190 stop:1573 length:384 start_codon:yes stop_codon:yes gene_type:complete
MTSNTKTKRGKELLLNSLKEKTKPLLKYVKNNKVDKPLIRKYMKVSDKGDKKYSVVTPMGKIIYFGSRLHEQFKDTGLGFYSKFDHLDVSRRAAYKARHKAIRLKSGEFAYMSPEQPSFYSYWMLWN